MGDLTFINFTYGDMSMKLVVTAELESVTAVRDAMPTK